MDRTGGGGRLESCISMSTPAKPASLVGTVTCSVAKASSDAVSMPADAHFFPLPNSWESAGVSCRLPPEARPAAHG
jgi:hypothetical protein